MAAASYTSSLEVVEAVMHNGAPVNNASQVQVPLQRQRRPVYLIVVIYGGPLCMSASTTSTRPLELVRLSAGLGLGNVSSGLGCDGLFELIFFVR